MPVKAFDLVVSFEVFEHSPAPAQTLKQMLELTHSNRLILLSTLCQPADIETRGMAWWYCTPRNGHISLHTNASLDHLADQADIALLSLTPRAMRRSWPGFKQSQRCRP